MMRVISLCLGLVGGVLTGGIFLPASTDAVGNAGNVKQIIVEKHGGSIEVNSVTGKGTDFIILLPASVGCVTL